ncbi:MAG: hypothetical protein H6918_06580 [Sphingomonadaceae bacterium]|nr:hypothetical protein [Sphingomonadaceae bacterium]
MGSGMDRPGSLWSAIGALFLLAALFLPLAAQDMAGRLGTLRSEGKVDLATVTAKRFVDRERTNYRGVPRPGFSDYYVMLSVNTKSVTPHGDYVRTQALQPFSGGLNITHELEVPGPVWDRLEKDDTVAVTFLPDHLPFDKDSIQLTEVVEEQGSASFQLLLWALALVSGMLGAFCLSRGWKAGRVSQS